MAILRNNFKTALSFNPTNELFYSNFQLQLNSYPDLAGRYTWRTEG